MAHAYSEDQLIKHKSIVSASILGMLSQKLQLPNKEQLISFIENELNNL